MKKYFSWLPNFITLLNLISGCFAIVAAFNDQLHVAAILVIIASVFDFLDGLTARALNAYTPIGKELDSLADVISFGLLPSVLVFKFLSIELNVEDLLFSEWTIHSIFPFIGFIVVVFSALRLARFNIDERQSDSFIGLPTPANAILIASVILLINYKNLSVNPFILSGLVVFTSFLLVSEFPMFSLKFKHFSLKGNEIRYILIAFSVALLIIFKIYAFPLIIFSYIVLSIFNNVYNHFKKRTL